MHVCHEEILELFEQAGQLGQKGDRWTRADPALLGRSITVILRLRPEPPLHPLSRPRLSLTTSSSCP